MKIKTKADLQYIGEEHGMKLRQPISSSPAYIMGYDKGLNIKHAGLCPRTTDVTDDTLDYLGDIRRARIAAQYPDVRGLLRRSGFRNAAPSFRMNAEAATRILDGLARFNLERPEDAGILNDQTIRVTVPTPEEIFNESQRQANIFG